MKYGTIREAAQAWVREMNAFPYGMIETLIENYIDDWHEITPPSKNDRVDCSCDGNWESGEITDVTEDENGDRIYEVTLDDDRIFMIDEADVEVQRDSYLPMWGTLWQFGDSCDDWWIENGGLQIMADCGFRIYEHDEWGYFFGIDGAGYDFYEDHWIPLYKARGLQWHETEAA